MAAAPAQSTIRTIVVGTDFSDASKRALHAAAEIAHARSAALLIVHAVDPMITTLEISPQTIIDDVREGLKQAAAPLKARGIKVETQVRLGKPWWAIIEAAKEAGADLVVIASHGRTGLANFAMGSVADRVLRACVSPVLMLPVTKLAPNTVVEPSKWKTAVAAVDFSEESRLAAAAAVAWLDSNAAAGAAVVLFHTVALTIDFAASASGAMLTSAHWDESEAVAREQLRRLASTLTTPNVRVDAVTFRGHASDGILHQARTRKVDFIAMGTHGRGAISRTVLGSVAERVVHLSECPVLTVRHSNAAIAGGSSSPETGSTIYRG